jgi:hypothetical protein
MDLHQQEEHSTKDSYQHSGDHTRDQYIVQSQHLDPKFDFV